MNMKKETAKTMYHEDLDKVDSLLNSHFPMEDCLREHALKVGPVTVRARMAEDFLSDTKERFNERYGGFEPENPQADYNVDLKRMPELDLTDYPDILVRSRTEGRWHYIFRWDFIARFDTVNKYGCMLVSKMGLSLSLDTMYRIAVSFAIVEKAGFLVHAAAIKTPEGALLFPGITRSGKSKLAELAQEDHMVITDDMALVEKTADGYNVCGTPFWGQLQMSINICSPLARIYFVSRAEEDRVMDLPATDAIGEMLKAVLYFGQDPASYPMLVNLSMDLLSKIRAKGLLFMEQDSIWNVIKGDAG